MKKLILLAALGAALGACGDATETADDASAVEAPAASETVAEESSAGTYEFDMDGTATVAVLNADGTYTDSQNGEVIESGTWEDRPDGAVCFASEGGDDTVVCFTLGEPAADGSMVATPDNGTDPLTIRKTS